MSSILTSRKVLVLNKGWSPVSIVTLRRAIILLTAYDWDKEEPKAEIIDTTQQFRRYTWKDWAELIPDKNEEVLHSPSRSVRIPEVILLSKYNKLPQQRIHFSRRTIYKRDEFTCQYCGGKPGTSELSIDHIIPRSRGGLTTWENCVVACTDCNLYKADHTPEEVGMKLRKQPVKPKWKLHRGEHKYKSWSDVLGEAYWETELQNDMMF